MRSAPLALRLRALVLVVLTAWLLLVLSGLLGRWLDVHLGRGLAAAIGVLQAVLWLTVIWLVANIKRRRAWLAIGAVAIVVLLAEVAVRLLHPLGAKQSYHLVYNPQLHHSNPASAEMVFQGFGFATEFEEQGPVTATTNSLGLRTTMERDDFLDFDRRVVTLGDSFTFGLNVGGSSTFPAVLEEELKRRTGDESLAVLNAGVTSFSPLLAKFQLQDFLTSWRPHLVILMLDATDIGDDLRYSGLLGDPATDSQRFVRRDFLTILEEDNRWSRNCALVQRAYYPYLLIRGALLHPWTLASRNPAPFALRAEVGGVVERDPFFIYRHPLDDTLPFFEATESNVSAIASTSRELGAEFLLVVSPRFHHWDSTLVPDNWEKDYYALDEPYQFEMFRFWQERRDTLGYPIFDLLDTFRDARPETPLVFRDDPHWTAAGHRLVGETLARHIEEQGYLTRTAVYTP